MTFFPFYPCHAYIQNMFDVFGLTRCHRWSIVYFTLYTETSRRSSQKVSEEIALLEHIAPFTSELIFVRIRIYSKHTNIYIRFSSVNIVLCTHFTTFGRNDVGSLFVRFCLKWNGIVKWFSEIICATSDETYCYLVKIFRKNPFKRYKTKMTWIPSK